MLYRKFNTENHNSEKNVTNRADKVLKGLKNDEVQGGLALDIKSIWDLSTKSLEIKAVKDDRAADRPRISLELGKFMDFCGRYFYGC